MIPELGHFALILALVLAVLQGTAPLVGVSRNNVRLANLARPLAFGQLTFVALAFAALTQSFVSNDFSVLYVATHSNSELPLFYRIAGVWGGHEGSLLLWLLMLAVWMFAVSIFSGGLPDVFMARVLAVLGLVSSGFLLFTLLTSNPFARLIPAAPEGRDLNPLLQDPGMVFHPPLLYMGYVGFSVAFAFAIAALLGGRFDAAWARWSRPWTTAAWMFLTLGIAVGSFWAYYELGWGGWWFWDPVENASFMPWLVGTALIHSLAVTEKRGTFRAWTVLLAIIAFSMSLLGTFLVRSGVLTSVHAFATDPTRGVFILILLSIAIGGSLALFAWRAPAIEAGGRFAPLSRETLLLGNNVLLLVATATVLLGTLYPLILDALGLGKISVGPPYFESVFVPLMTPVLFLMGVGPIARWKKASLPELAGRLKWAAAVAVVTALLLPLSLGRWDAFLGLGFLLGGWILAASATSLVHRLRAHVGPGMVARLRSLSPSFIGMVVAHAGMGVFVLGVTAVKGFESEVDVRVAAGASTELSGYTFRFQGIEQATGPNYAAQRATVDVFRGGAHIATLHPEKRVYRVQRTPMTEAAIDATLLRHLYVALGEPAGDGAWSMRIHVKPFVSWIWVGCILMALGGLLAVIDRRYRSAARSRNNAITLPLQEAGT